MNERELRQALKAASDRFEAAKKENNLEEMRAANKEVAETRELLDMELSVRANKVPEIVETKKTEKEDRSVTEMNMEDVEKEYTSVFLKSVRKRGLNERDLQIFDRIKEQRAVPDATPYLSSDVDANGGLIIPKDVQTRINQYKRQFSFELQSLVSVERTSMLSGTRVFEKLADSTPWVKINQWDTIPEVAAPQFEPKEYKIEDYGGILPIPRTMLQDTDAALMDTIARHIARKTIITRNAAILAIINTAYATKVTMKDVDDFKDALNVTLDPAFAGIAKVITNQDGFNYLDKLKNDKGEYLLQPDVTSPTGKSLLGKPVVLVPNRDLASKNDAGTVTAPVFIGSMSDAVTLFDRGVYEVKGTDVGGDSFKRNSYDIRVIDRFDVQLWDKEAVIAGALTVTTP